MKNEICLDFDRSRRIGLSEAVLCRGKSAAQLLEILRQAGERGQQILFTRLDNALYTELDPDSTLLNYDTVSKTAVFPHSFRPPEPTGEAHIAVVSAGSSDIGVAREAVRTLAFYGQDSLEINDVGVAGLWRLQKQLPVLEKKRVIICVAGMDAALPTVLGGLVSALVVAVPSSTGYGIAREGEAALHALLCSCAQGLVVVNIDNGFGAACAALRALGR